MTRSDRPNILLITADDMDAGSPSSFGGPAGITPNLDRLAADGIRFTRAHVVAAVCQPSRSAIMTGLVPHRNGAEGFEPINDGVTLLTELLADQDYELGILGKVGHIAPVERFGWDFIRQMEELGLGRDPGKYGAATAEFLAGADGRPWFLMANAHDPHRPFHGSADEAAKWPEDARGAIPAPSRTFDAAESTPPGFLPDLEGVRTEYAQYLASVRRCDDVVGAVLAALDASGQREQTLVIFLSDNGMAFPFAKANCYLRSTLTPLIMRWPGRIAAGTVDERSLVSSLDFFPTITGILGLPVDEDLDGLPLQGLLEDGEELARDTMFTVFHETSGKRRFEMRCAQDRRYGYIWNQWAGTGRTYVAENMDGLSWAAMATAATDAPEVAARAEFYLDRAPEELYDLSTDPFGLRNLADDPAHADVLNDFRQRIGDWMADHGDPQTKTFRTRILSRSDVRAARA
ncbi:sulfatase family protein [Leifsonia virtsii]|uniref:Sulfatase n=1 Tax=Leifsonia virtsii TaxID=3035915 RepID=A0ABT8J324_9MICO|nr:sulfatase [Leifsonia virtsii]MDN4599486.1 sulfatase [Leifsonia virtsii]